MLVDRYAVYVVHPETGDTLWFLAPSEGVTPYKDEAFLWTAEGLAAHIELCRAEGGDWGQKDGDQISCRIRQVWLEAGDA